MWITDKVLEPTVQLRWVLASDLLATLSCGKLYKPYTNTSRIPACAPSKSHPEKPVSDNLPLAKKGEMELIFRKISFKHEGMMRGVLTLNLKGIVKELSPGTVSDKSKCYYYLKY